MAVLSIRISQGNVVMRVSWGGNFCKLHTIFS